MGTAAPRAVRIARPRAPGEPSTTRAEAGGPTGGAKTRMNRYGSERGSRLFLLFTVLLLVIFLAFASLLYSSPAGAANSTVIAILALVGALFVGWAWSITWARAPRSVRWLSDGELLVLERLGTRRRYPGPPALTVNVAYRYAAGIFNGGPVELVEVSASGKRKRAYLVEAGTFDLPRAPDTPASGMSFS